MNDGNSVGGAVGSGSVDGGGVLSTIGVGVACCVDVTVEETFEVAGGAVDAVATGVVADVGSVGDA